MPDSIQGRQNGLEATYPLGRGSSRGSRMAERNRLHVDPRTAVTTHRAKCTSSTSRLILNCHSTPTTTCKQDGFQRAPSLSHWLFAADLGRSGSHSWSRERQQLLVVFAPLDRDLSRLETAPGSGFAATCHDSHSSANKNCYRLAGWVLNYDILIQSGKIVIGSIPASRNCAIVTNDKDDVLPLLR